jgi:hypothetical protein
MAVAKQPYLLLSAKFTVMVVSISVGSPFNRYGLYVHCRTAAIAATMKSGLLSLEGRSDRI